MAHEVLDIRDEVIKLRLSSLLTRADMAALQELALRMIRQGKKPRVLAILDSFQGWATHEDWNEIDFLAEHGDDIVRMALVGDDAWKDETYLFVGKGLRATEIEFFSTAALDEAERWVAS